MVNGVAEAHGGPRALECGPCPREVRSCGARCTMSRRGSCAGQYRTPRIESKNTQGIGGWRVRQIRRPELPGLQVHRRAGGRLMLFGLCIVSTKPWRRS